MQSKWRWKSPPHPPKAGAEGVAFPPARRPSVPIRDSVTKSVDHHNPPHACTATAGSIEVDSLPHPAADFHPETIHEFFTNTRIVRQPFVSSWFSFVDGFPHTRRRDSLPLPKADCHLETIHEFFTNNRIARRRFVLFVDGFSHCTPALPPQGVSGLFTDNCPPPHFPVGVQIFFTCVASCRNS